MCKNDLFRLDERCTSMRELRHALFLFLRFELIMLRMNSQHFDLILFPKLSISNELHFRKEIDAIRSSAYIRATINSFTMISKVSIFLSLVSYVYFGNVITARKVFIVSSYFNILNVSMVGFWPIVLTYA